MQILTLRLGQQMTTFYCVITGITFRQLLQ